MSPLLRRWMAWTVGGEVAGFVAPALAGVLTAGSPARVVLPTLVAAGAVEGLLLGAAQAHVLVTVIPGLDARRFAVLTSVAASTAYLVGMAPSAFGATLTQVPAALLVAAGLLGGVVFLCSLGTAQWFVLRGHVDRAWTWVVASGPSTIRVRGPGWPIVGIATSDARTYGFPMTLFRRGPTASTPESEPRRRLRYLLHEAPAPLMRSVVAVATEQVSAQDRDALLAVVREQLMAGQRTANDAYDDLGRLVVLGEHRTAGSILRHLPEDVHERLADAVLRVPAVPTLMDGYAAWDGSDPRPATPAYDKGAGERSGHGESHYDVVKGRAEGGFST